MAEGIVTVHFFLMRTKTGALSTFCLCNVPYVSMSFKCAPQTMEGSREMDGMRRRNGNQSHSRLEMMEEVNARAGPEGKRFRHENMMEN